MTMAAAAALLPGVLVDVALASESTPTSTGVSDGAAVASVVVTAFTALPRQLPPLLRAGAAGVVATGELQCCDSGSAQRGWTPALRAAFARAVGLAVALRWAQLAVAVSERLRHRGAVPTLVVPAAEWTSPQSMELVLQPTLVAEGAPAPLLRPPAGATVEWRDAHGDVRAARPLAAVVAPSLHMVVEAENLPVRARRQRQRRVPAPPRPAVRGPARRRQPPPQQRLPPPPLLLELVVVPVPPRAGRQPSLRLPLRRLRRGRH